MHGMKRGRRPVRLLASVSLEQLYLSLLSLFYYHGSETKRCNGRHGWFFLSLSLILILVPESYCVLPRCSSAKSIKRGFSAPQDESVTIRDLSLSVGEYPDHTVSYIFDLAS